MKINKISLFLVFVFTFVVQSRTLPRKYKILCKLRPDLNICSKLKNGYQLRLRDDDEFEKQSRREQLIRDLTEVIKLKKEIKKLSNGKYDKRSELKETSNTVNDCLKSTIGKLLGLRYCLNGKNVKVSV